VSVEAAEGYAEPWDVNDGLWKFWDCDGRVLVPSGRIDEKSSWTRLIATPHLEPDALRSALHHSLQSIGLDDSTLDALPLDDLCQLAKTQLQVQGSRWMDWQPLTWLRDRLR